MDQGINPAEDLTLELSDEEKLALSEEQAKKFLLQRARMCYEESTDYIDTSLRLQWEKNLSHFRNDHAQGSKYRTDAYRFRSKHFRPKTRSSSLANSAALASALFTNNDLISITAQDQNDKSKEAGSKLMQAIVQYRLEETIPWFMTVLGAYQDTENYGVCISKTEWQYSAIEKISVEPAFDMNGMPVMEDGLPMGREVTTTDIKYDRPWKELLPPENFRFDPNADWRDPVEDSPYLIELIPMYAYEVQERMESGEWDEQPLGTILAHGRTDRTNEATQQARHGREKANPGDTIEGDQYSVVWVHFNILKENDEDLCFYSIGTGVMLTDPEPLEDVLFLGRESYRVGFSTLEAHNAYPAGRSELGEGSQVEINDITNQRNDNVKLALNKRYLVRRGGNVNLKSLSRNVPGGGIVVDDPGKDVDVIDTPDVTSSSYNEQDRLNVEMDELLGNFSQSSVQTNRSLNETVGGMDMAKSGANQVQELSIRLFIESWVEPEIRSLVKLIAKYEDDAAVLALAADKAQLLPKYGIDQVTDDLLDQDLIVKVNVGMGNTSPTQKIQRISTALNTVMQFDGTAEKIDSEEVNKEVFGSLGYSDGERFLLSEEKLAERPDPGPTPEQMQMEIDQARLELEREKIQISAQMDQYRADKTFELGMARLALDEKIKLDELYGRLGMDGERVNIEREKLATERQKVALVETNKTNEQMLKREMGSGI